MTNILEIQSIVKQWRHLWVTKNSSLIKFNTCKLSQTSRFDGNSSVFIGHAYGSHSSTAQSFLSPNVENFIRENSSKLNTLVFTGDVFSVPSVAKWKKLRTIVPIKLDILIAPGNHDIGRPDSRDVFKISEFGKKEYPISGNLDGTPLILENSIDSNGTVSSETAVLINSRGYQKETVIIARHLTPIKEFFPLVNNGLIAKNLVSIEQFIKKFDLSKKYYWIIGDSGAFKHLPRLSCLKFKNHIFLINGIGGDSVIIYRENQFF